MNVLLPLKMAKACLAVFPRLCRLTQHGPGALANQQPAGEHLDGAAVIKDGQCYQAADRIDLWGSRFEDCVTGCESRAQPRWERPWLETILEELAGAPCWGNQRTASV